MGPPQVSFLTYYRGPPQISFFAYYMGPPSDQFVRILYGGPLRPVSSHTIWGPLRSVSLFTTRGAPQVSFFAYYMGLLDFFHFLRFKLSLGAPYTLKFPVGAINAPSCPPPPLRAPMPQYYMLQGSPPEYKPELDWLALHLKFGSVYI